MSDDIVAQIAGTTGPLGTVLVAFWFWLRGELRELKRSVDHHDDRLSKLEAQASSEGS